MRLLEKEIKAEVQAVSQDLHQSLDFNQVVVCVKPQVPALFARVRDLSLEIVELSLGPRFGRKLKEFVDAVDPVSSRCFKSVRWLSWQ